jgi:hypothetical protein
LDEAVEMLRLRSAPRTPDEHDGLKDILALSSV